MLKWSAADLVVYIGVPQKRPVANQRSHIFFLLSLLLLLSISLIACSANFLFSPQLMQCPVKKVPHICVNGRALEYLAEFCHPSADRRPGMRSADSGKLHVPRTQTSFGDRSFAVAGPRTWNNLPDAIRDSSLSFLTFTKLKILFVCLTAAARCDF